MLWRRENLSHLQRRSLSGLRRGGRGADHLFSAVIAAPRLASAETRTPAQLSEAFATTLSAHDMDGFAALFADNYVNHQVSAAAAPRRQMPPESQWSLASSERA